LYIKINIIYFFSNRENPNVFDYAFILTTQEPTIDKIALPSQEYNRREKVKNIQAYGKIYVNNLYLTRTKPLLLSWPDYSLDFDSLYNLTINTRPTRIHMELYLKTGWVFKKVCVIEINPPGIYMNTVTSSSTLYEENVFDNSLDLISDNSSYKESFNRRNSLIKNEIENKYIKINNNNLQNDLNSPGNKRFF